MGSDPLSLEGLTLFISQNCETSADASVLEEDRLLSKLDAGAPFGGILATKL